MKISRPHCCILCLALAHVCCGAPTLPAVAPHADSRLPVIAKYLNPGGSFYLAMDGGQWSAKMDQVATQMRGLIGAVAAADGEEANVNLIFHFVDRFLRDSGLRELAGWGASSVRVAEDMHHNRLFVQHSAAGPKGFLWEVFTAENGPLDFARRLPAETVFARWATIRPQPAWEWVRKAVAECGNPELVAKFDEGLGELKAQGVDLDRLVASLPGGVGMMVTADPARMVALPLDLNIDLEVPAFGAALLVEVTDDGLYDLIGQAMAKEAKPVERTERDGIRAMMLPEEKIEGSELAFRFTVARFERYLVLASSDRLVATLASGQGGLLATPHVQRWRQGVPEEGFAFLYMNPLFTRTIFDGVVKAMASEEPEVAGIVAAAYAPLREISNWSVTLRTPDGVAVAANQSAGAAQFLLTHAPTINLPVLAGMLLPALAQAREKARRITDMNNLKQIALGLHMHAQDHAEKFPDDLGDLMAGNYLGTGRIFVCPASRTRAPTTPEEVRAGQCDYLYFGKGKTLADLGTEHPIACTKPGLFKGGYVNVLYGDGHVESHARVPPELQKLLDAPAPK